MLPNIGYLHFLYPQVTPGLTRVTSGSTCWSLRPDGDTVRPSQHDIAQSGRISNKCRVRRNESRRQAHNDTGSPDRTDASKECVGGVLSQLYGEHDHPVAFFSKKLGQHELNWPTHEKELFAIKLALEKWRHYLYGREFDIYTDNSACAWLLNHPKVSPKLARFLTFFAQFSFKLHYLNGPRNVVADALSRTTSPTSSLGTIHEFLGGCSVENVSSGQDNPATSKIRSSSTLALSPFTHKAFVNAYKTDHRYRDEYAKPTPPLEKIDEMLFIRLKNCGLRLCVPESPMNRLRTNIIGEFHDSVIAAHPGVQRTMLRIKQ